MTRTLFVAAAVWLIALSIACQAEGVRCDRANFRIAVDVGHTPEAKGAKSARGVPEYDFNLALGSEIVGLLGKAGYPTLRIVVHGRGKAQLLLRTSQARDFGARLLLSIHHDDVQAIYKSNWTFEGGWHSFSDRYSGYSLFVSSKNTQYDSSIAFARLLGIQFKNRGLKFSQHHAENIPGERRPLLDQELGIYTYDNLVVLRTAASPAVLLEAGIISNRIDETVLGGWDRRQQLANLVLAAVNTFCETGSSALNR
ncbi:N-acetylmuramoyl-L-alanine amidase [Bradyrhizobium sp. 180]|uniref:N-acetylmuramoyl-L-alanine amidase family protein n=1 Tax=Bradyrhizobium sp. 180 TaxID=2782650 RepID=UPI001FF99DAE|nr:N-acetylmuramoyl-L-alanine amidase [Bradyrhizobium sp. 180]MCK1489757.1 N-acetylmuramoyl-L-alanine amidase [Bradyrhizobium sp. 180]